MTVTAFCKGGPLDGRRLSHHATGYRLAYLVNSPMKGMPGMVTSRDPEVAFGLYAFDASERIWNWRPQADRVTGKSRVDSERDKSLVP